MANEKRLIDANALFDFLKEQREKETGAYFKGRNNGINVAIGAIRNEQICPTVDAVEVVHARWRWGYNSMNQYGAWCAECECGWEDKGTDDDFIRVQGLVIAHKYCPNCGAKMDGGNEDV